MQPTAVSSTVSPDTSFSSPDQSPFITRPKGSLKGKEKAVSSEADDIVPDDAEEMPTLAEVDKELVAKRLKAEKDRQYRELQERKKRLVAEQEAAAKKAALAKKQVAADDDEDELEIDVALGSQSLAIEEDVPGRLKTTQATRRAVLRGIVSPRKSVGKSNTPAKLFRHPRLSAASDSQVKSAGKADVFHVHVSTPQKASTKKGAPKIDQDTLNAHLFQKAAEGAAKARKERDEEWTLRGGRSLRLEQLAMKGGENVAAKLQEAIERVQNAEAEDEYYDEEEDGEDQEYQPEDDEVEGPSTAISESEKENNPPGLKRRSRSRSPSSDDDEDKENQSIQDKENVPPSSQRHHQVTSDDDEENFAPPPGQSSPRRDDADFIPIPRRRALNMIVLDDEDKEHLAEGGTPPPQDENQPPPPPGLQFDGDSDDDGPPRPGGLLFGGAGGKALLFNSSQESLGLGGGLDVADGEIEGDGFTQLFQLSAVRRHLLRFAIHKLTFHVDRNLLALMPYVAAEVMTTWTSNLRNSCPRWTCLRKR